MADLTQFDFPSAVRIARAVRGIEQEPRRAKPLTFGAIIDERPKKPVKICTFSSQWAWGTLQTVAIKGVDSTVSATNIYAPVAPGDGFIAKHGGDWYLIGVDLTKQPRYSASKTQMLGHGSTVEWFDITTCDSETVDDTVETSAGVPAVSEQSVSTALSESDLTRTVALSGTRYSIRGGWVGLSAVNDSNEAKAAYRKIAGYGQLLSQSGGWVAGSLAKNPMPSGLGGDGRDFATPTAETFDAVTRRTLSSKYSAALRRARVVLGSSASHPQPFDADGSLAGGRGPRHLSTIDWKTGRLKPAGSQGNGWRPKNPIENGPRHLSTIDWKTGRLRLASSADMVAGNGPQPMSYGTAKAVRTVAQRRPLVARIATPAARPSFGMAPIGRVNYASGGLSEVQQRWKAWGEFKSVRVG